MPADSERAILVGLDLKRSATRPRGSAHELPGIGSEESIEELEVLATSAGANVLAKTIQSRDKPEAATLIGSGKVNELAADVKALGADTVIFDRDLSPTQQRNLERQLGCKVVDRTQLILDIFARRARTSEGQLQVELAQLNYLLPRLAGRGNEMSRLGGGIGTRGPGETQLETDRRRIFGRIRRIEENLEAVREGRKVQRRQRQAVPLATVSLVGYTNAGKSTLFNRLTQSDVLVDAKMFATLDPTVRQMLLPSNRRVLLSDTVGFISNLPTTLVKAFRATLEEVTEAALLLHVIDVSSPHAAQQTGHVLRVLGEIGAAATVQLLVLNKMDLLEEGEREADTVRHRVFGSVGSADTASSAIGISARTGAGIAKLLEEVDRLLPIDPLSVATFRIPHSEGAAQHLLYEYARVIEKRACEEYSEIVAETPESVKKRLSRFLSGPRAPGGP
jgi:GTPase